MPKHFDASDLVVSVFPDTVDAHEDALDVLHLDMDCFFAAVEARENAALFGLPVIVGGTSNRGVVASASYEARAFGVRSAMSTVEARKRCPEATFVAPRLELYSAISRQLLEILRRVTPYVEPIALDEAYINVNGAHRLFGESCEIAKKLRADVAKGLGLSCSVGIGRTKLIAKLASKDAKPRSVCGKDGARQVTVVPGTGVRLVGYEEEGAFLQKQSLRALPGIGPKKVERLRSLGITTVADAAEVGRDRLCALFGKHQGDLLADVVNGLDPRRVEPVHIARSVGHEVTFPRDVYDHQVLESHLKEFAVKVVSRARGGHRVGKTVNIKVRFADFSMITRSKTPLRPPANAAEIAEVGIELLKEVDLSPGIRLLGLHLSNFVEVSLESSTQLAFFVDETEQDLGRASERQSELEDALHEIRDRFGHRAVDPLSVIARRSGGLEPNSGPT